MNLFFLFFFLSLYFLNLSQATLQHQVLNPGRTAGNRPHSGYRRNLPQPSQAQTRGASAENFFHRRAIPPHPHKHPVYAVEGKQQCYPRHIFGQRRRKIVCQH